MPSFTIIICSSSSYAAQPVLVIVEERKMDRNPLEAVAVQLVVSINHHRLGPVIHESVQSPAGAGVRQRKHPSHQAMKEVSPPSSRSIPEYRYVVFFYLSGQLSWHVLIAATVASSDCCRGNTAHLPDQRWSSLSPILQDLILVSIP